MSSLVVSDQLAIPEAELSESFARSSGPGGQNVNKVETKVELRWSPVASEVLTDSDRARLLERLSLTSDGELIVTSSHTRDQTRNRADARRKLAELVRAALVRPKRRRPTRPSRGAVRRRLEGKRRRSETKKGRQRNHRDD